MLLSNLSLKEESSSREMVFDFKGRKKRKWYSFARNITISRCDVFGRRPSFDELTTRPQFPPANPPFITRAQPDRIPASLGAKYFFLQTRKPCFRARNTSAEQFSIKFSLGSRWFLTVLITRISSTLFNGKTNHCYKVNRVKNILRGWVNEWTIRRKKASRIRLVDKRPECVC